jgi:hypothetical protein
MTQVDHEDARTALVTTLLQKIKNDPYPSSTMMDMVEELLTPDEIPAYVVLLQDRLREDRFPSIPMLKRLKELI